MTKSKDLDQLTPDEIRHHVEEARKHLAAIRALFPGTVTLTKDDRQHSQGKLRDGETRALGAVLDAVDVTPAAYQIIGDRDEGHDPGKFETSLLRDRLARLDAFRAFAAEVDALSVELSDTVLHIGEKVKPPLLLAYRIARVASETNHAVRTKLAPALDYFATIGQASLASRNRAKTPPA